MNFFELITNPKWVRRKIIVSLLINNSSSGCDTKRVTCRPNILSDKSEAFSKEKLVPLKFWSMLEELVLGQEKTDVLVKCFFPLKPYIFPWFLFIEKKVGVFPFPLANIVSLLEHIVSPPFWNCSDIPNLLLVCYPHPSLIQEIGCWDTNFCMMILAVLHLSTKFARIPPW